MYEFMVFSIDKTKQTKPNPNPKQRNIQEEPYFQALVALKYVR